MLVCSAVSPGGNYTWAHGGKTIRLQNDPKTSCARPSSKLPHSSQLQQPLALILCWKTLEHVTKNPRTQNNKHNGISKGFIKSCIHVSWLGQVSSSKVRPDRGEAERSKNAIFEGWADQNRVGRLFWVISRIFSSFEVFSDVFDQKVVKTVKSGQHSVNTVKNTCFCKNC